jgi:serine/threonine protein kinase
LPKPKPFLVNSYKGTKRAYMAPELHKLIDEPKPYDPFKADVFSFGVVLFCLLF